MGRRDDATYVEFAGAVRPRLRRAAYLMCGDWELASDIVQEALIRVYVAWPRLDHQRDHSGGQTAYARKCVVTVAIDWSRRRASTEVVTEHDHLDRAVPGMDRDVVERAALMAALRALAPRQRACVVLRYFEDLDVAETARILGCAPGTVKSQTARALDTLRHRLELRDVAAAHDGRTR